MRKQETAMFQTALSDDPIEIMVTALDGNAGGKLGARLIQIFGPGIVGLVTAMEGSDQPRVMGAAGELFSKLSEDEFERLKTMLLKGAQATANGEARDVTPAFIGEAFAGHPGSLYKLLFFALKLNFSSFFHDLGLSAETMSRLQAKVAKAK